jgi:hypothetical protein
MDAGHVSEMQDERNTELGTEKQQRVQFVYLFSDMDQHQGPRSTQWN